jgi:predicted transcriptional regulator
MTEIKQTPETIRRIAGLNKRIVKVGISQRQVALQAGMDPAWLHRILSNKVCRPSFWTFARIEEAVQFFEKEQAA